MKRYKLTLLKFGFDTLNKRQAGEREREREKQITKNERQKS